MILDMETTKVFLTVSIFVLMSFSLLVAIRYGKVNKWTYVLIPFILVLSMTVKTSIENMLGYPTKEVGSEQQLYLTHFVGVNKEWIYIWAYPPPDLSFKTDLIIFLSNFDNTESLCSICDKRCPRTIVYWSGRGIALSCFLLKEIFSSGKQ